MEGQTKNHGGAFRRHARRISDTISHKSCDFDLTEYESRLQPIFPCATPRPECARSVNSDSPYEIVTLMIGSGMMRLAWQNTLFKDRVRIIGAVRYPQGMSVLSTQPFYAGERTEQPIIDIWFEARGWQRLTTRDGAFYHKVLDLMILDALPRNVLTLKSGDLMPFDVVIVKPDEMLKARFDL